MGILRHSVPLLVLLCLGFNSCDTPAPPPPRNETSGEKIQIGLQLREGQIFRQFEQTTQKILVETMGLRVSSSSTDARHIEHKVMNTEEGWAFIEATFARIRSEVDDDFTDRKVYDSSDSTASPVDMDFLGLSQLIGQYYTYLVDTQGHISNVSGFNYLYRRMESAFDSVSGQMADPNRRKSIEMTYDDDAMALRMARALWYIPSSPVTLGDSWSVCAKQGRGFPADEFMVFKLERVEDHVLVLSIKGRMQTKGELASVDPPISFPNSHFLGKYEGTMELDRATGWLLRMNLRQYMIGNIEELGRKDVIHIEQVTEVKPW
jgi:Family of unknown function (DUF6263)